jgi:biotin-dependent carboxylase-like uncharacterized protein
MKQFSVVTPGAYTTVQDGGRFGFQKMGVPISGVLDPFAHAAANLLVGNRPERAVLEITVMGPKLEVLAAADVALCGGEFSMTLNGDPVPGWRSTAVTRGDVLEIHQVKNGCRGYLAVTGGIDVPEVMGSRSTYPGARIGGFAGRPLKPGDRLPATGGPRLSEPREVPESLRPEHPGTIRLRAIPGPQDDYFAEGLERLFASDYMITAKADRMGYRLQGPEIPIVGGMPESIVSEPSMPGGIQIPADRQPIILLVEQTVGGYAKIATVISSDLSKVAQATPGDTVRFASCSIEEAHLSYRERQEAIFTLARLFE